MNQENIKISVHFRTADLALATAISLWYPVAAIDRTNPQKAEFIFKREPEIDEIIQSFWQRQLKVDALGYFNQLKSLKARLYESKYI